MTFVRKQFKGKKVFVEVDENGDLVLENGRAKMKYGIDDENIYRPWPKNLSDEGAAKKEREKKKNAASTDSIIAYTDGGCIGNPGPSGLGYLIYFPDGTRIQKGEPLGEGTNNIAELMAIERVLDIVSDKTLPLIIYTDSTYSIGVLTMNWKIKANRDLILRIKEKIEFFDSVKLVKVRGHDGIEDNELVDDLARISAQKQEVVEM